MSQHSSISPTAVPANGLIRPDVELSCYTTYHIGGTAEYFAEATCFDDLRTAFHYARTREMPFFLLGGGSNVLVSDKGVRGLVVRNLCGSFHFDHDNVTAESGMTLASLLNEARKRCAGGLEFLAGIPGSVGGGLYGNAGAYGRSIGEKLIRATILSPGGSEKLVGPDYFRFSYRYSAIKKTGDIILDATFRLEPRDSLLIEEEMSRIIKERTGKHPCGGGSCGCYFKNVDGPEPDSRKIAAGKLLEEAGAKAMSFGNACVSERHANFILNPGKATACEIKALAGMIKKRVYERFNIILEEEVQCVGDFTLDD